MDKQAKAQLRRVAKAIAKLPRKAFNMGTWVSADPGKWPELAGEPLVCESRLGECGTTCCLAGWVILHAGYCMNEHTQVTDKKGKVLSRYPDVFATKLLGIGRRESSLLFYSDGWPEQFKRTPKGASKRILHLVETGQ